MNVVGIEHGGAWSGCQAGHRHRCGRRVRRRRRGVEALVTAGHTYLGDGGIPDRYALAAPGIGPARHLYVTVAGSLSLRNHLAARDVLRADPVLRDEYGALKLGLATHDHPSSDDYVAAKSTVPQRVLRLGGLTDDELVAIDALNMS